MLLIIMEILMFVGGVAIAATGIVPGRDLRKPRGFGVRIAGGLLCLPIPLALCAGVALGPSLQGSSGRVFLTAFLVELGIILGCFVAFLLTVSISDSLINDPLWKKRGRAKQRSRREWRDRRDQDLPRPGAAAAAGVGDDDYADEAYAHESAGGRRGLSTGAILGIVGGAVGLVVLIVVIIIVANQGEQPAGPGGPGGPPAGPGGPIAGPGAAPPKGEIPLPLPLPPPKIPPPATDFDGLLAYWPFEDDDPSALVADVSKTGNDGKAFGAQQVEGIRGKALALNENVFLDYGTHPSLNFRAGGDFTFACWMKSTSKSGMLISQRHSKDDGPEIDFFFVDGRLEAHVREDKGTWHLAIQTKGAVNDDRWHHCALVRFSGEFMIFRDGAPAGRNSGKQTAGAITTDLRAVGFERRWGKRGMLRWPGTLTAAIDEVCIFGRALAPAEIQALAGR